MCIISILLFIKCFMTGRASVEFDIFKNLNCASRHVAGEKCSRNRFRFHKRWKIFQASFISLKSTLNPANKPQMTFKFSSASRISEAFSALETKREIAKLLTLTCGLFFKCIWRENLYCFVWNGFLFVEAREAVNKERFVSVCKKLNRLHQMCIKQFRLGTPTAGKQSCI